jgi:hypothetical protein
MNMTAHVVEHVALTAGAGLSSNAIARTPRVFPRFSSAPTCHSCRQLEIVAQRFPARLDTASIARFMNTGRAHAKISNPDQPSA